MAFTVTATQSGASSQGGNYLAVKVLTGATEAGGASNGGNSLVQATAGGTLTPNFSSSLVVFSISADLQSGVMPAAATNNTYYDNVNDSLDNWSFADGHYSGTVTSGVALTYGASVNGGNDHANWCAYEIKPSVGGVTPALDASTPALAADTTHTLSITTASFTPPAGSVLAALIATGGTGAGAGISVAMSDTSGLSLVWTRRAVSSLSDNFQPTWIFTTTIPSGPASVTPAPLPQGPLPNVPVIIPANSGWRNSGHSR